MRMLKSAIQNAEIEKQGKLKDLSVKLDEEEILALLRRQAKQLEEALADFVKGGRADLVEQTKAELAAVKAYLPAGLSDEDLKALVEEAVKETGASGPSDFGRLMGVVMKKVAGRADGNTVRAAVLKLLNVNQ